MTDRAISRRHALAGAAGVGLGLPVLAACGNGTSGSAKDRSGNGGGNGGSGGATLGPTSDVAVGGDSPSQIGAAHDLFQVHGGRQRLAHAIDVALLVGDGGAGVGRQDLAQLYEDAGARFILVRHLGHDQPAREAQSPGDRQRDPAAHPHRMERRAQFLDDPAHPARPLRTCSRG